MPHQTKAILNDTIRQYLLVFFGALVILLVLGSITRVEKSGIASAGSQHNLSGYAWSDNIGWVSFNCTNNGSCASGDYGVNVDAVGNFSGYAWSDNIGWVSFNSSDVAGCPQSPCSVHLDYNTGAVTGWAKALAGTGTLNQAGGWDGWIALRSTQNPWRPSVSFGGRNGYGYSWGSDVVGWLSWRGSGYGVVADHVIANMPPTVAITSPAIDPLDAYSNSRILFEGTATDVDGYVVSYEWREDDCSTGTLLSTEQSFQTTLSVGDHVVYLRAVDDKGAWSDSIDICPSRTLHIAVPPPESGACGTANGDSTLNPPTGEQLCTAGAPDPSTLSGNGPWSWVCKGLYGGGDSGTCSATNSCGNNVCDRAKGETPSTCRQDCQVNFREF